MINTPQKEKGFLQIASGKSGNDILHALVSMKLNGTEYQIMLTVIRKTWGWNKKEDWISISQFEKITNKSRRYIIDTITSLVKKRLLVKKTSLGKTTTLSVQKDITLWDTRLVKKTSLVKKRIPTSEVLSPQLVNNTSPTKDTITKDTITKDTINSIIPLFEKVNPFYKKFYSNKTERKSLQNIIDKYGEEWTINIIKKLPDIIKIPYAPPITSPYELEVKMGKLKVFLQQEGMKKDKFFVKEI